MSTLPDPESLLPLPAATFHILISLSSGDRHGYAIIHDVAMRTNNRLRLGAGTLYRSLQRMLEQGLILDCAIAKNETEGKRMWELRENMTESQVVTKASPSPRRSLPDRGQAARLRPPAS